MIDRDGYSIFPKDQGIEAWAQAAHSHGLRLAGDNALRAANLRHGGTWFAGVDVLPNAVDGSIDGVALPGAWRAVVPDLPLHPAQLSIIYPGYPRRDPDESAANHAYRVNRLAAHVDGLLPVGAQRRRFALEHHAYVLAIPLNAVHAAPTVVWRGSHVIMQAAIAAAIGDRAVTEVDLTDAYHDARRRVFDRCDAVPLNMDVGQAALIHRFALHGTEVWPDDDTSGTMAGTMADPRGPDASQGRMIAFLRPQFADPRDWLRPDQGADQAPT